MSTYMRRRRQIRNRIKMGLVLVLAAVILTFLYTVVFANSNVQGEVDFSGKAYMAITVESNDTLWSIAEDYMSSDYYTYEQFIQEVSRMNRIDSDKIYAGDRILIPVVTASK